MLSDSRVSVFVSSLAGIELWRLCDFFQRFVPGYHADERWVKETTVVKAADAFIKDERASVRVKLLDAIGAWRDLVALARPLGEDLTRSERDIGANAALHAVLIALDRICPEEI